MYDRTFNIIGAGKLGQTLAYCLAKKTSLKPHAVFSRDLTKAQAAAKWIGAKAATNTLKDLPEADLQLVAVTDDAIEAVTRSLVTFGVITPSQCVMHFSALHSTHALAPAIAIGAKGASLHPIKSFTQPKQDIDQMENTPAAWERPTPLPEIEEYFKTLGFKLFSIKAEHKTQYHALLVICCNYLVTLMNAARTLAHHIDFSNTAFRELTEKLVRETLSNFYELGPEAALTGPLQRGDVATISQHIDNIKDITGLQDLYTRLGLHTLPLVKSQLPEETFNRLFKILCLH